MEYTSTNKNLFILARLAYLVEQNGIDILPDDLYLGLEGELV